MIDSVIVSWNESQKDFIFVSSSSFTTKFSCKTWQIIGMTESESTAESYEYEYQTEPIDPGYILVPTDCYIEYIGNVQRNNKEKILGRPCISTSRNTAARRPDISLCADPI